MPQKIRYGMPLLLVVVGLGLGGCLHEGGKPPVPTVRLLGVLTAPTEVPNDLAWDGEALWVADLAGDALFRVSPEDGRVLRRLKLPGLGLLAQGVAWDGEALWVALSLDEKLYRLSPEDGRVRSQLPLTSSGPDGANLDLRGLAWDGEALWLLTAAALVRIDPRDGRILRELPVPVGDPQGIAWRGEGEGRELWLIDRGEARLLRFLPTPEGLRREGGWPLPPPVSAPVGLVWAQGELWISDEASGALFRAQIPTEPQPRTPSDTGVTHLTDPWGSSL